MAYMILGGEDGGRGAIEPSDKLGHAVPHLPHLLRARERVHHEVPWRTNQRDYELGFQHDTSSDIRLRLPEYQEREGEGIVAWGWTGGRRTHHWPRRSWAGRRWGYWLAAWRREGETVDRNSSGVKGTELLLPTLLEGSILGLVGTVWLKND